MSPSEPIIGNTYQSVTYTPDQKPEQHNMRHMYLQVTALDPDSTEDRHVQGRVWYVSNFQYTKPYACSFHVFAEHWRDTN